MPMTMMKKVEANEWLQFISKNNNMMIRIGTFMRVCVDYLHKRNLRFRWTLICYLLVVGSAFRPCFIGWI